MLDEAWRANAPLWVRAVRENRIPSRATTDAAIIATVMERRALRVLDLGCGEGWLMRRALAERHTTATGIDGCGELVAAAREADPEGDYRLLSFADFVASPDAAGGPFDVAVFNFALLDDQGADLLAAAASLLAAGGVVIVQTLHPWAVDGPYRDGWRSEDFATIAEPGENWRPMPWYFRTLQSWVGLVRDAGLALEDLREPVGPDGAPLSLLLVAGRTA